jgi:hypothetical protein
MMFCVCSSEMNGYCRYIQSSHLCKALGISDLTIYILQVQPNTLTNVEEGRRGGKKKEIKR